MRSFALGTGSNGRARVIKAFSRAENVETPDSELISDERWVSFWDLMDTIKAHGYMRAAMGVVGRSTVGTWWQLRKHKEFSSSARELHRRKLIDFYMFSQREWNNIKDYYSMAYKIMVGAMYLRYFGFCAFQIVRDELGNPLGLDFLHGYVQPNVDERGFFKKVAFIQYPDRHKDIKVEFEDPLDIVYIVNPDWEGYPSGGSDIQSLEKYTLPLDLYLQTAAREYMQNRNTPEAYYVLSPDISEEAFDNFVEVIESRYAGPQNVGRNPVAIAGDLDIKTVSKIPQDLPYQGTRESTRMETLAASGVHGPKLGITDETTNSNLREIRREFHETSMLPLFRFLEQGFYEQIHVREFGYSGWELVFNSPDFLTEVEKATVHMRYHQMRAINPNEIRHARGYEPRPDELGDLFIDQLENMPEPEQPQGSPPEGREDEPDAPGEVGEPTIDDQDPPRGDNHDDEVRDMLGEVRRFRTFVVNRLSDGRSIRPFRSDVLPGEILNTMQAKVDTLKTVEEAYEFFDSVIGLLEENYGRA